LLKAVVEKWSVCRKKYETVKGFVSGGLFSLCSLFIPLKGLVLYCGWYHYINAIICNL
jgi:hypothetical protein